MLRLFLYLEHKNGHLPTDVTTRLSYWKADLQKFGFPAAECILPGLVADEELQIWLLLTRIIELVFSTGRNGFTDDNIQLLSKLVKRHNGLVEETRGLRHCVVTLHNLEHIAEDIQRFSSPENFQFMVFFIRARSSEEHWHSIQCQKY